MTNSRTAQTSDEPVALAADFAAATEQQWLGLVEKALKGADFDKVLMRRNAEGVALPPLFVGDAGASRAGHGLASGATDFMPGRLNPQRPWQIEIAVDLSDPEGANKALLEGLENGASAICLQINAALPKGTPLKDIIATALRDVRLELVPVAIEAGSSGPAIAAALIAHCKATGQPLAEFHGSFGIDPFVMLAYEGALPSTVADEIKTAASAARFVRANDIWATTFDIRTPVYHLAGASDAQELGIALACATACLRGFEAEGLDIADTAEMIGFSLAADARIFETIAKFRAARLLWARLLEAAGITPPPMSVGAVTAERMMSRADPHVNLLRTTTAALAAGMGGADSILVSPYDAAGECDDALAVRLARNIQLVIQSEAHAGRVVDPAAGSYYVEALTQNLAQSAWAYFQEIEAAGGIEKALCSGFIAETIKKVADDRDAAIAKRKMPLTGVSEFPDIASPLLAKAPEAGALPFMAFSRPFEELVAEVGRGRKLEELGDAAEAAVSCAPLTPRPLAKAFEDLRDQAADAKPVLHAATFGAIKDYNARLLWLRNALAAGGVDLSGGEPCDSVEAMVQAFKQSGATAAAICANDLVYGEKLGEIFKALRAAGAKTLVLAGKAPDGQAAPDLQFRAGADLVAALTALHDALGISAKAKGDA